ncbi:hypothetical protein IFM89_030123 [Coptis chinensis]|uniref:Polycomb protein VEFS-Box domain-containing protein n=1 Tax=Coptis chinensis TaxID=261450 RepID=A0A835M240_9MAGN|nr:hypothetical protein IFM89_030123 [Coptis chinensis]
MPGLPLSPCKIAQSRMCRQDSRTGLSEQEAIAAEESLSVYCKPVELYNILERRATHNPLFLQRCLKYRFEEKNKKRIKMSISLSWSMNKGVQLQSILPLYVLLVTPVSELGAGANSTVYRWRTRERMLCSSEFERRGCSKADFILPEMKTLLDQSKSGKLFILLVSCGDKRNSFFGGNLLNGHVDTPSSPAKVGGYCLWGKIPFESLYLSWNKCASLSSEHGAELMSTVDMRSCFLESCRWEKERCITIRTPDNPVTMQLRVNIFAQEAGLKDNSPYNSHTNNSVHNSSLPHIMRMRTGNVVFNYKYYNNTLQKTEAFEVFPQYIPHCESPKTSRVRFAWRSVEALRALGTTCVHRMTYSTLSFGLVTEEYQAVNVSVKNDIWRSEIVADGVDPKLETFFLCSKPRNRITSKSPSQNAKSVHTSVQKLSSPEPVRNALLNGLLEKEASTRSFSMPTASPMDVEPSNQSPLQIYDNDAHSSKERDKTPQGFLGENDMWNGSHTAESNGATDASLAECVERVPSSPNFTGVSTATAQSSADPECLPLASGSNLGPPAMLQFAKTRKLSAERSDPRNRILLQKRQFFHSHRAQPMALEQVFSDRDSEDEVDDDVADFEDRRMLDDFVDVTKDEKQIMHLWNSFVRKQRVLADGHIPWACEAFSRLHGRDLVQAPALFW